MAAQKSPTYEIRFLAHGKKLRYARLTERQRQDIAALAALMSFRALWSDSDGATVLRVSGRPRVIVSAFQDALVWARPYGIETRYPHRKKRAA